MMTQDKITESGQIGPEMMTLIAGSKLLIDPISIA
jgi:hypothetical protein